MPKEYSSSQAFTDIVLSGVNVRTTDCTITDSTFIGSDVTNKKITGVTLVVTSGTGSAELGEYTVSGNTVTVKYWPNMSSNGTVRITIYFTAVYKGYYSKVSSEDTGLVLSNSYPSNSPRPYQGVTPSAVSPLEIIESSRNKSNYGYVWSTDHYNAKIFSNTSSLTFASVITYRYGVNKEPMFVKDGSLDRGFPAMLAKMGGEYNSGNTLLTFSGCILSYPSGTSTSTNVWVYYTLFRMARSSSSTTWQYLKNSSTGEWSGSIADSAVSSLSTSEYTRYGTITIQNSDNIDLAFTIDSAISSSYTYALRIATYYSGKWTVSMLYFYQPSTSETRLRIGRHSSAVHSTVPGWYKGVPFYDETFEIPYVTAPMSLSWTYLPMFTTADGYNR